MPPVNTTPTEQLLQSANAAIAANDLPAAVDLYEQLIAGAPGRGDLRFNLGVLLKNLGTKDRALEAFEAAARLRPAWPAPELALGHLTFELRRYGEACAHFERALRLTPDSIEAMCNLGLALDKVDRPDEARRILEHARALAPGDETVFLALRPILFRKHPEDALHDLLQYESVATVTAKLIVAALNSSRYLGDDRLERKYLDIALKFPYGIQDVESLASVLGNLQYFDVPIADIRRLLQTYDELQQARLGEDGPLFRLRSRSDARVRVGYLSADFRFHVMGLLMQGIIGHHDRSAFSIRAYSLMPARDEDAMTNHIRGLVDAFMPLAGLDDRAAAARIAEDDLDILVDLMGHSAGSRPGVLLYKPAPVIISHLGLHGAIGLRQIDFRLTDPLADIDDAPEYSVETPLRLSGCVMPFFHAEAKAEVLATRQAIGLDDSHVVFGAFVGLSKLSPRCLTLWREIIGRIPQARLAFSPARDVDRAAFVRRAAGFGISEDRLAFIPMTGFVPMDRTRYSLIDIALDTMPYAGGDTTVAALDSGIPVVTLRGARQAERMGYSILAHLGVTETVADTDAAYIDVACRLATDRAYRSSIATRIAERVRTSGIADLEVYTRRLERAYRQALALTGRGAPVTPTASTTLPASHP